MTGADVLLAVLAVGVAIFLARGSHPAIAVLLVASALLVSAILFLPTPLLTEWVSQRRVQGLHSLTSATPLDPSEWIHFLAFAWLGLLIWLARANVRSWRGVLLVAALGVAAELSQGLTDARQLKMEDAALNVVGGMVGVLVAQVFVLAAAHLRRRRRAVTVPEP